MGKLPRAGTNKREKLNQSAARPASFPAHWHLPCPSVPWPIMHHHTWNPELEPQVVLLLLKPHPWSCVPESSCSINFSLVTNHRLFDCKSICPSSQQQCHYSPCHPRHKGDAKRQEDKEEPNQLFMMGREESRNNDPRKTQNVTEPQSWALLTMMGLTASSPESPKWL